MISVIRQKMAPHYRTKNILLAGQAKNRKAGLRRPVPVLHPKLQLLVVLAGESRHTIVLAGGCDGV